MKNKHTSDTVIFGLMSLEKPNAGKPVQLSKGSIIKQFQNTIWVPEMAHPTKNALSNSTSQSKADIPTE